MRRRLLAFCFWVSIFGLEAGAADIESLEVERQGNDYQLSLQVLLDAPLQRVWAGLVDYARFPELSPSITDSQLLEQLDPLTQRVRTHARTCVLVFCKETTQVQILRQRHLGDLSVEIEPELSDFEFGQARWRLSNDQGATRLRFEASLRPAFWVPPLIGPWAIERAMREEARSASEALERMAREGGQ